MAKGMSPRKAMAGNDGSAGNFGMRQDPRLTGKGGNDGGAVKHGHSSIPHPDHGMTFDSLDDDERAAPPPIKHSADKYPSQANPDHGPHHIPK